VGPAALLIGVAIATPLRLILGHMMPDYRECDLFPTSSRGSCERGDGALIL
jgi:hypothetical protein